MTFNPRLASLGRAALPVLAIASFALGLSLTLAVAGDTLGYDFLAYRAAAGSILTGAPIYDPTVDVVGAFGLYFYPPPFAVAFVPFALLPSPTAVWIWTAVCVAMTIAAIALMPVTRSVRWVILLLAGIDWAVMYGIKLGQVGPVLLLAFAIGWRLLKSEEALGLVGAVGSLVKAQPGLLFGWALLTQRWRMLVVGLVTGAIILVVTLPIVGLGAWPDYLQTLGRVSSPVTNPKTVTLGAIAFRSGLEEHQASIIQFATIGVTLIGWIYASRWRSAEVGFLATVVASQLLSPLLWEHYAMLLLLPVAWLIERGERWAMAIPIATSIPLLTIAPPVTYPIVFLVCLFAPILVTRRLPA